MCGCYLRVLWPPSFQSFISFNQFGIANQAAKTFSREVSWNVLRIEKMQLPSMKLTTCPVFRLRVASEEQQQQQLVYVKWVCLVFRCNSWSRTCLAYSQFYNAAYSRPINSMISSCIWKTRATTHLCRFLCMQIAVSHWLKITQNVAFEIFILGTFHQFFSN